MTSSEGQVRTPGTREHVAVVGRVQKSVISHGCDREWESENINWELVKDLLFLNFLYKC